MKYQHRVLGFLSALAIITYLDRVCIAVAGSRMQEALHISPQAWGWVLSAFFISYSVFEIPSGMLGDRIGPRRVLTRIVLWWSAFTSLTGAVASYPVLLVVRFCFGAGEAGAYPNIAVVIGRWMPSAKRASTFGIVWMMSQLGGALAPLLVMPIVIHYGWQAAFYLFGSLGVIWGAAWYWWFRDSPAEKAGVTPEEIAEIGQGRALSHHPGLPWAVTLRSGNLWRVMALAACYVYTLTFFQSWFQTFLVKGRGFTEVGLMLSTLPYLVGAGGNLLGGFASDWLSRRLGLRNGRRFVGAFGLGVAACGLLATILTLDKTLTLIFLSLVYGGLTFQQSNTSAVCLDIGGRHGGAILGFMNTAANASGALSSVVFGYLVAHYSNYTAPLIPMLLALCVGAVLWLTVDATRELYGAEGARREA
jgi:MFS family permease